MPVTFLTPPVQAKGVDESAIAELIEALASVPEGQFISNGETYGERSEANKMASKLIRVVGSRTTGLRLRSRTWESEPGAWVFGIRPKDAAPENGGDEPVTDPAPAAEPESKKQK